MRIAYLGPAGTFSQEALRRSIDLAGPNGADAQTLPLATVHAVVNAIQTGEAERAIVPIENALEGSVNEAIDALLHDAPGVCIVGEMVLPVRHCLVARPGLAREDVRIVISHPQALAQCARWLREALPGANLQSASSTAEAVRLAATTQEPWAALGTALAAELYGGEVLAADLGDAAANATRFLWLAPSGSEAIGSEGAWKSSVVFGGDGDGRPGWLVRCLSEFAFRGVNLTRIESRPARRRLGHYVFLVDLEGRADAPGPTADAVRALAEHCSEVRVLGSYPRAPLPV